MRSLWHLVFSGFLLLPSLTVSAQTTASTNANASAVSSDFGSSIIQMLFGLLLVLGLLIGGLWLLKRLTTPMGQSSALLKVVGGTAVGARERIVVVEIGQTWLILGVTPSSINTLAEMPRQPLPPGTTPNNHPDFAKWIEKILPGGIKGR